ncbi:hypothetical protein PV326_012963 [Microctonus aethiopoides]|nr:hypothetical protein PV326_012963 [Microctonus aethiopoides]
MSTEGDTLDNEKEEDGSATQVLNTKKKESGASNFDDIYCNDVHGRSDYWVASEIIKQSVEVVYIQARKGKRTLTS